MPETQQLNQQIVERLRLAQPRLSKLPPEHQKGLYGVIFDRYLKPQYTKLKLSDAELNTAKDQWIAGVSSGKPQPLPENFGVDKKAPTTGEKILAGAEAGGAGVLGGIRNVSEFVSRFDKSDLSKDPIHKALSEVEHKAYDDALALDPTVASWSAGAGHMVAGQIAFEGAGGLIPKAGLLRSAVGAAGAAPVYGATGVGDVAAQTAINVAVDALLGGLGRVGARGARTFIGKFSTSENGVAKEALKQVESAGKKVATEKFNGKSVGDLSPAEFDEWHKQTQAAIQADRVKANEASKAVKDAKAAQKPSRDELIIQRAREKDSKDKARRAASDASKALQKGIVEYKKRTGSIPEGEHLELLKQRKNVTDILGEAPKKLEKVITQVTNEVEAKTLQEGSPQTLEAVQAIQSFAGDVVDSGEVIPTTKKGNVWTEDENTSKLFRKAEQDLKDRGFPPENISRLRQMAMDEVGPGHDFSSKYVKFLQDAIKKHDSKAPMFKSDIASIMAAETPEAFARAKKDAIVALHTDAMARSKNIKSSNEGLHIAQEERKEIKRINAIPVPEHLGGRKAVDSVRKAAEKGERVGMVVAEAEKGQEAKTIGLKAEQQMADPEVGVIDALDHQKKLLSDLETLSPASLERVKKAIKGDTIEIQNGKIEEFIERLKKLNASKVTP